MSDRSEFDVMEALRRAACKLPKYSFWLSDAGGVVHVPQKHGNWVEFDALHALFDAEALRLALAQYDAEEAIKKARKGQRHE